MPADSDIDAGRSGEQAFDPIFLIDELLLRPGHLEDFLTAFRAHYLPGATARGQRLLQTLVTPPTTSPGIAQSVLLVWQLDGLEGFWGMRSQNASLEVAEWWRDCEKHIEARTRRYAASPDAIERFEKIGRLNA